MARDTRTHSVIKDAIRRHLGGSKIVHIEISDDVDHDGDPIWTVEVIFDPRQGAPDVNRTATMIRHIHNELAQAKIEEDNFPILHYIANNELPRERR